MIWSDTGCSAHATASRRLRYFLRQKNIDDFYIAGREESKDQIDLACTLADMIERYCNEKAEKE